MGGSEYFGTVLEGGHHIPPACPGRGILGGGQRRDSWGPEKLLKGILVGG
jgi:hypothetical protein